MHRGRIEAASRPHPRMHHEDVPVPAHGRCQPPTHRDSRPSCPEPPRPEVANNDKTQPINDPPVASLLGLSTPQAGPYHEHIRPITDDTDESLDTVRVPEETAEALRLPDPSTDAAPRTDKTARVPYLSTDADVEVADDQATSTQPSFLSQASLHYNPYE